MNLRITNGEDLENFYLRNCAGSSSLFEIWEAGGARGDSVTPSTYSPAYRRWMSDKLAAELTRTGGGLLSLGCGNAAVEAELVHRGHTVLAVDAMAEAVELARDKGVKAICADIWQWEPAESWSVVYLDGVLGHLYDRWHGLKPVLARVRSWLAPGAALVCSNDTPANGEPAQPAPGVDGFYWLSAQYMADQALESGFDDVVTEQIRYRRPLSGERARAVMVGHVTG
jgi:SAM-dependent methyltransferase